MKHLLRTWLLVWLGVVLIGTATSAPGADWAFPWLSRGCRPDCVGGWCCDDYHPKPLPCVEPVNCFGCDDYCAKPLPCAVPIQHFCCDDYCRKCLPPVCRPLRCDLVCPPSGFPLPAYQSADSSRRKVNAASTIVRPPGESANIDRR